MYPPDDPTRLCRPKAGQSLVHSNLLFIQQEKNYSKSNDINQIGLGFYNILKLGPSFLLSSPIDRLPLDINVEILGYIICPTSKSHCCQNFRKKLAQTGSLGNFSHKGVRWGGGSLISKSMQFFLKKETKYLNNGFPKECGLLFGKISQIIENKCECFPLGGFPYQKMPS